MLSMILLIQFNFVYIYLLLDIIRMQFILVKYIYLI